ncbi:MAG: glycosyltransferase family 4 protein [Melioribacteraceae bacterium]|nr:glycosyltransferase family 4 protein [Melioribacteraceae bacterium]
MKILIFSHFFKPESGAAPVRIQYLVEAIKNAGFDYFIISPYPNYPDRNLFKNLNLKDLEAKEKIKYLPAYFSKNDSPINRMISYFTYMITSVFYALFFLPKFDVVINSSPPITTSFAACFYSKIKGSKFIWDIRDIWPDIGIEIGIIKNNFVIKILRSIENFLLKYSSYITVTANGDKENLINKGYNEEKIITLFNGADTNLFIPISGDSKLEVRKKYLIPTDKKVLIYFGSFNYGMNDVGLLSDSLAEMKLESDKFHLLLIGDGNSRKDFIKKIDGIVEYTYINNLPKEEIAKLLASSDWSLIPRKFIMNDTGGNIPVKCFESWSCGIPVLLSSIDGTEVKRIFDTVGLGKFIQPNDKEILKKSLIEILDEEICDELKNKGREFVILKYDRTKESEKLIKIIKDLS